MKYLQMLYFREVCRCNNITKASKTLFVSQPAISSAIKELEHEFGVQLFHRNNNKLVLTPEGAFFYDQVQSILDSTDKLQEKMKDLGNNHNKIKIGVPPMIGIFLFPKIFNSFKSKYPKIQFEILESGSLEIRHYVMDDLVDLAIGIIDDEMTSQFHVEKIYETELVFCVSKNHHLAKHSHIAFEMLKDESIILMKTDSFQNPKIKERFSSLGITPNILLYSSQLYTIKKFLEYGNCGAFVFKEVADMDPDLIPIPFDRPIQTTIGMIWKNHSLLYSETEDFIRFVKEEYGLHK